MRKKIKIVFLTLCLLALGAAGAAAQDETYGHFAYTIDQLRQVFDQNKKSEYQPLPELTPSENGLYTGFISDQILVGFNWDETKQLTSVAVAFNKKGVKEANDEFNRFTYYCGLLTSILTPRVDYSRLIGILEMENVNETREDSWTLSNTVCVYMVTEDAISFVLVPLDEPKRETNIGEGPWIVVDGETLQLDAGVQSFQGRIMVPLRGVLEKLGATVDYSNRTVKAKKGETTIQLPLNEQTATVNGEQVHLDVPAVSKNGRVLVPIRFISERLDADVKWDEAAQTVTIITEKTTAAQNQPKIKQPLTLYEYLAAEKANNPPTITLEEFNQIKNGMTYEDVVEIIGGEGTLLSESGSKNSEYYTVMYSWEGTGSIGANANCMFQGGFLISKAQFGLK